MNNQERFEHYINMLHRDSDIPICAYLHTTPVYGKPRLSEDLQIPEKYVQQLIDTTTDYQYILTDYGTLFGCIRMTSYPDMYYFLGPTPLIPYGHQDTLAIAKDYGPDINRNTLKEFLDQCTSHGVNYFVETLEFCYFCIEQKEPTFKLKTSTELSDYVSFETEVLAKINDFDQQKELTSNDAYIAGSRIMDIVRRGDVDALETYSYNDDGSQNGIIGPTSLRHTKNSIIVMITMLTRAAVEGGMNHDKAYYMSDQFINQVEKRLSPTDVLQLGHKITRYFTEEVKRSQLPMSTNDIMQRAILYIQQHVNQPVTAADVAAYVGFSRSYFSNYFKEEFGFTIQAFITRTKLEEGKHLLQYSSKSISEIADYLCFSNQSHFQSVFKKHYGVTPLQFRKNPNILNEESDEAAKHDHA